MGRLSCRFRPLRPKACRRPRLRSPQPSASRSRRPLRRRLPAQLQSPVGTADATSSTPTTPVAAPLSQSPDSDLDPSNRAGTRPNANRVGLFRCGPGLAATEAPKPATEREPEPAAHAQATASSAQSPVGTADGTSSTVTTAVAAPPPSQSADHSLTSNPPPTNGTPIVPASSTADQGLPATEAPKPATEPRAEPERPPRRQLPAHRSPLSGPQTERHRRSQPRCRRPLRHRNLLMTAIDPSILAA